MLARMTCRDTRARSRGFALVELMVALTVGLLVVVAGLTLVSIHVRANRSLVHESRLVQDLRSAADMVTRGARRAGYWADAAAGVAHGASAPAANPYVAVTTAPATLGYAFSRDAVENHTLDPNEAYGFRLNKGVIEMRLGGKWQALTDAGTLVVTAFDILPTVQERALGGLCLSACAAGSTTCPPRHQVRSLAVRISARSVADAKVLRSIASHVRLRNDAIVGACPA